MMRSIAALILFCGLALAQSSGVLVGVIVTGNGEPVGNTKIVLVSATDGARRETATDELGIYAFSLLPAGDYLLEIPERKSAGRRAAPITIRTGEKRAWRLVWQ
jgi:hypothetical protein